MVDSNIIWLGYMRPPDGTIGPSEVRNEFRNKNDIIIAVNGTPTRGKKFKEYLQMIRNCEKDTYVVFWLRDIKEHIKEQRHYAVMRQAIKDAEEAKLRLVRMEEHRRLVEAVAEEEQIKEEQLREKVRIQAKKLLMNSVKQTDSPITMHASVQL